MELRACLWLILSFDLLCDSRLDQLARVLIRHSTKLQKAEHVLIELFDAPDEMGIALIRASAMPARCRSCRSITPRSRANWRSEPTKANSAPPVPSNLPA